MPVQVAGVNHNDVLGRRTLLAWLRDIKRRLNTEPTFVAVEYEPESYILLQQQRSLMRKLTAQAWPGTSDHVLDVFEASVVYEGDLHREVFPGVETVWLETGRMFPDQTVITDYARDRLNIYKSFVSMSKAKLEDADLEEMSHAAWARCQPREPGRTDKDTKFASIVAAGMVKSHNECAIAIVGSSHASRVEGSMVSLLEEKGIQCNVSVLRP